MMELLLGLFIMSTLMVISLAYIDNQNLNHMLFASDYHYLQSQALLNNEVVMMETTKYPLDIRYPIYFNDNGKVNMAQSINFRQHQYTIRLGFGNLKYE